MMDAIAASEATVRTRDLTRAIKEPFRIYFFFCRNASKLCEDIPVVLMDLECKSVTHYGFYEVVSETMQNQNLVLYNLILGVN